MSNIYEKLQAARVELQNKKLKKSGKNKFSGFDYFELSDFLPSVNEIFNRNKMLSRFYIVNDNAVLDVINSEKPDETISFMMPTAELELKGCNKLQALGGVNTYLRRYLYLNALEIVEADLFDAEAGKTEIRQVKANIKAEKPAEVEEEETNFIDDADFDIISGMAAINDLPNLKKYWNENYDKVKDLTAFTNAKNARKKALGG